MEGLKCMLIGNSQVGKTDLFLSFTTGRPASHYEPTVFETLTKEVQVEEMTYNVGLWDSAGDAIYDQIRPISYPHTDCFVICYAVDDRASFENVEKKWKPEVLRFGDGPSVPIILAGLKSDLRKETKDFVSFEEGEELKRRIGAKHFLECCTHNTVKNVETVLQRMVECAANKKSEEDKPTNPIWGFEDLKIVVCGDTTVGKSALLKAHSSKSPIQEGHNPTTEVMPHYQDLVLDGIEYFLGLFDLPSTPEFLHDRIKEYQKANGVIICYAVNDPFSFQNVEQQWLPEIKEHCPHLPFIILGNKKDVVEEWGEVVIPTVDGEELMLTTGASAFIECSAKTLENVPLILTTAAKLFGKVRSPTTPTLDIPPSLSFSKIMGE